MAIHIGVDVGGTFTDVALFDSHDHCLSVHKLPTTPSDPSRAIQAGVQWVLRQAGVDFSQVDHFVHGTTLVANAIVERRGPVTGMLCTAGFVSVLDIGREHRYDVYDLRILFPPPLIPLQMRREVNERILFDAQVEQTLDADEVLARVQDLVDTHEIFSLAVCFVNSYLNPAHERQAREIIASEFPQLYISTSADVCPVIREYERWTTATVNAYSQPIVDRYLTELESWLRENGCRAEVRVMSSDGSMLSIATAKRYPVRLLESGAAASMQLCAQLSALLGEPAVLALDMGGTTAKGGMIQNGALTKSSELEIARAYENRRGSGLGVRVPVVDVLEIGVGGGSIAKLDLRNIIQIGPEATGVDPGPACFGKGGTLPTVADANLLLGYYDEESFLGGRMRLNRASAENALTRYLVEHAGIEQTQAAWGVHESVNESLINAFGYHAAERGLDYRRATLIASGGAAPAHALRIARRLDIDRVVFPVAAGVMSAVGLLAAPVSFELMQSYRVLLTDLSADGFSDLFRHLERNAVNLVVSDNEQLSPLTVSRRLDMRYSGQGFEIEVPLPEGGGSLSSAFPELPQVFEMQYRSLYQLDLPDRQVEIVGWKVAIVFDQPLLTIDIFPVSVRGDHATTIKGHRQAYFPEAGGFVDCPVFDRYALCTGDHLSGPALIEEDESTTVVGVGNTVDVDRFGHLIATVDGGGKHEQRH
jgi:N-methylhydantoinase A